MISPVAPRARPRSLWSTRWTIKNGVVFDNARLIEQVLDMVAESKEGWTGY